MLTVRNPYTGETISELPYASAEELRRSLGGARRAFERWRGATSHERSRVLSGVARGIEARAQELAALIRDEAGKPIQYAEAEVARAIGVFQWAAAEAQRLAGELLRLDTAAGGRPGFGIHSKFPRGVILGITPFNFPLNLVAHKVAPAVACGCPILIKPSPAAPLAALKLAELFREAGAPEGLVQVALADDAATEALTRASEIAMVSFTGSARVGHLVRAQAVDKPVTLELGGNAWVIVLQDVDPSLYPAIARRIAGAAFGYAGQSCISVQNVAAPGPVMAALKRALAEATEATPYGDTAEPSVVSGPVINTPSARRIRKELDGAGKASELIRSTRCMGADANHPLIVAPTLVSFSESEPFPADSSLVREEIFGPVMALGRFSGLDEAIQRVNRGRYGLQAGIFTQDWRSIERLYRDLRVGGLVVNDVPTTRYDHQPYGGVKDSGQGREGIRYAMEEMTESKFLALSSRIPGVDADQT